MMHIIFSNLLLEGIVIFLLGTVFFDVLHYLVHLALSSKNKLIRTLGKWHSYHHRFYPGTLQINTRWLQKNLYISILIEYSIEFILISFGFFFFNALAVILALTMLAGLFCYTCLNEGKDFHHRSFAKLPSQQGGPFVTADYHALHHVYPNKFFSSYLKLIDIVLGTAHHLQGKTVALTGANGALGSNMKILLEKEGCTVIPIKYGVHYTYDNYIPLKGVLSRADILCLCHGTKYENTQAANCDSFVEIIELFKSVKTTGLVPREVWGVGSEIECHPCFGIKKLWNYARSKRNFARHARHYYQDKKIMYRHLVHSAFSSPMGPGLMSAPFAAWATLFLIKRGFKYIPVTYTGFAYINYLYFLAAMKLSKLSNPAD